jgi:cobalamin synthase
LVGAGLGLGLGGLWWVTAQAWPAAVAAALVVGADLAVTGLLHLDGLVDTADGVLPHLDRARRLEVMDAPDTGAFGVGVAAAVLLARWAALATLRPAVLLVGGLWCLSRTGMAIVVRTQPYARPEGGLASIFRGGSPGPAAASATLGCLGAVGLAMGWRPLAGGVSVAAAALLGTGVVALCRRRLGGFTGDVLGAAGMMAETAGLVAAAAKW